MVDRLIKGWAKYVIQYRWVVILCSILVVVVSTLSFKNLYYDNSNETFFIAGDPAIVHFDQLIDRFGGGEMLLIGLEPKDSKDSIIDNRALKVIDQLTTFLQDQEAVDKVTSLTNYQAILADDDSMRVKNLVDEPETDLPVSQAKLEAIKRLLVTEKLAIGSLVSLDLKHTVISAKVQYIKGKSEHKVKLMNQLRAFIKQEKLEDQGYKLHFFGNPHFGERFVKMTQEDQALLNPLMGLVMLVLLFFSFKNWPSVILPVMVVLVSLALTIGLQGVFQWPFNTVNTALPGILIILGIGDAVHLIVDFFHFRAKGMTPKESSEQAILVLWIPCFYTSLTTSIGFLSLAATQLVPVRQLGVLGAFGSGAAFLISLTLLPALLSLYKGFPKVTEKAIEQGWVAVFTQKLTGWVQPRKGLLIVVGFVLFGVSISGVLTMKVDSNYVSYFKQNNPVRLDIGYMDRIYNGGSAIDLMIDSGQEGGVFEPAFLKRADGLQQYLVSLPQTGVATSFINYIKKMNQSMSGGLDVDFRLPKTREHVAQYLLIYENSGPEEDLSDMRSADGRWLRLSVKVKNLSSKQITAFVQQINQKIQTDFPQLKVTLTGGLILANRMDAYVLSGVVSSFGLAGLLIGVCFIFLFRSFKYGLIAMIPSLLPILLAGSVMSLLGITLNLGTMIIGAMTIGLAVDDSIHVMNGYLVARQKGFSSKDSLDQSFNTAGRAVIFTSLILVLGFLVMAFGQFVPIINTGLFAALILFLAVLADLFFLPALLLWVDGDEALEDKGHDQPMLFVKPSTNEEG